METKQEKPWWAALKAAAKACLLAGIIFSLVLALDDRLYSSEVFIQPWDAQVEEDTLDVLFFGSSHVLTSVIPQKLYDDAGITSHALSISAMPVSSSYWLLQEALRTQSPKVVVVDTLFRFKPQGLSNPVRHIPLTSYNKYAGAYAVINLPQSPYNQLPELQDAYLYGRFFVGRTQLDSISKSNFLWDSSANPYYDFKGYRPRMGWLNYENYTDTEYEQTDLLTADFEFEQTLPYLEAMRELAEEDGFTLVLYRSPTPENALYEYDNAKMLAYAQSNGLPFIDANDWQAVGLDPMEDFSDGTHVNTKGALKVTEYISIFLQSHFDLKDHRNDDTLSNEWNKQHASTEYMLAEDVLRFGQEMNLQEFFTILETLPETYAIVVSSAGYDGGRPAPELEDKLRTLGFGQTGSDAMQIPYSAIKVGGEVVEQAAMDFASVLYNYQGTSFIVNSGYADNGNSEIAPLQEIYVNNNLQNWGRFAVNIVVFDTYEEQAVCNAWIPYEADYIEGETLVKGDPVA